MAKRKIAILGGGMAGLTAAWELTRTPQLAQENQVTVYQLGWRLGGKGASGRSKDGQILEHGLHIWFGCYDNAFRMLKDVYAQTPGGSPLKSWRDAFTPQNYALFGYDDNGQRGYDAITFDGNAREPGSDNVTSSLWDLAVTLYKFVRNLLHQEFVNDLEVEQGTLTTGAGLHIPLILAPFRRAAIEAWSLTAPLVDEIAIPRSALHAEAIKNATRQATQSLRAVAGEGSPRERLLHEGLELSGAIVRGVLSDCYLGHKSLDDLDAEEFEAWLRRHECVLTVSASTLLRTMYDTFFWYLAKVILVRPNVGAGTALTVVLRATCTYKQAITFKMNAGMGEVVVAPMYEALRARGVRFEFFRKLTRLELDDTQTAIRNVHLSKQASVVGAGEYQPSDSSQRAHVLAR